ncbi:MAG TPA: NAD(P)/FAD-dependent oxidoreductase [Vicinamibacterales bacterium]|nr:NAD(P)/FAD-dependent oxidoreductase [Vicinamibacterales bacterium]
MAQTDVLVIGAGPAGLATSRELARAGVGHTVLERGDAIAHTWTRLYDSLVLHTGKHLSALPGLPYPAATPLFPTRANFIEYLRTYASRFNVPVETRADVSAIARDGNAWIVRTADGTARHARALVVATGVVANPFVPELPNRAAFRGPVIHSVDYRRPEEARGRRIAIVGAGNSAGEIAAELGQAGAHVTLAVRSGAAIVPRQLFGVPIQYVSFLLSPLPRAVQRTIALSLGVVAGRVRGSAVLPPPGRSPCPKIPLIGLHLADAIKAGRVRVRGAVDAFTATGMRFADGSDEDFDRIILATGYRAALAPLGRLVHIDACGFACRRHRVESLDQPGVYFVGHTYDTRGAIYNIGRDARRAAAGISAYLRQPPRA